MAQDSSVIKLICDHSGCMEYDELVQSGAVEDLESVLANSDIFTVLQQNKSKRRVLVTSGVRRCRNRECRESCRDLHLCSFHLLGQCNVQRCKYGHSLETEHNSSVLHEHGLQGLSKDQLRVLLLQNDASLLPNVCVSYNKGSGEFGNCPEKESCRRLHVCEKYIRGLCDGGSECNRCHDFYEPHPMKTLQARGVSGQLIASLLLIYRNILTLKDHRNARDRPGAIGKDTSKTIARTKAPEYLQKKAVVTGNLICLSFIRGICKYGDKCWRVHFAVPYKWEVEVEEGWVDLPDNEEIEREYSDPSKIHSMGNEPVCFDTMMVGVHRVRRLSTVSSVLEPTFIHTTKWIWYWKNEYNKWIQYGSVKEMHRLSVITSEELEKKYLQFLDSNTHDVVKFSAGNQFYELNFKDMKQRNEITSSEREVRRRPFFVSLFDVRTTRTRRGPYSSSRAGVPGFWDKTAVPESGFQRVLLDASHKDYVRVQEHFNKTMKDFNILSIERVQNKELWEDFQTKRERMKKANSEKKYREAERLLFHGTNTRNVDAICLQNFDMRVSGSNATVYGQGSYFARDAKYSHDYTDHYSERCMFACRVLVGQYTKGASHYRRPPTKDTAGNLYDSCVNDLREPTIYVVFERSQVYPEFLITYEKSMGSTGETLAARSSLTTRNTLCADSDVLESLDSDDTSDCETKSVGFAAPKSDPSVRSKPTQGLTSLSRLLRESDNSLHATGTIPVFSDLENAAKPSPDCSSVQSGIAENRQETLAACTSSLATERTSQEPQQDSTLAKTVADPLDPFSYSSVKAKSVDASSTNFFSKIESETSEVSKTSCSSAHKQPPSDGSLSGSFSATCSSENGSQWLDDFDDVFNVRQTASVISTSRPHKANDSTSSSTSAGENLITSLSYTGLPRKSAQDVLASVNNPVSSYPDNRLLISDTSSLTDRRDTDTSRPKTESTYALRPNPDLVTTQRSQSSQQHLQKPVSPRQVGTNFSDPLSALSSATPRARNLSSDAFPASSYSVKESSISVMYTPTSSSANERPRAYGSSSSFYEKPPSPLSSTQTSQNRASPQQQKNVLEARSKQEQKCHIQ